MSCRLQQDATIAVSSVLMFLIIPSLPVRLVLLSGFIRVLFYSRLVGVGAGWTVICLIPIVRCATTSPVLLQSSQLCEDVSCVP